MTERKSLVKLALECGFSNLHKRALSFSQITDSIMSDEFEIIYCRRNHDYKRVPDPSLGPDTSRIFDYDTETVDIFGIVDPYDYSNCALFKVERKMWDGAKVEMYVRLEELAPLYSGEMAVAFLEGQAFVIKE